MKHRRRRLARNRRFHVAPHVWARAWWYVRHAGEGRRSFGEYLAIAINEDETGQLYDGRYEPPWAGFHQGFLAANSDVGIGLTPYEIHYDEKQRPYVWSLQGMAILTDDLAHVAYVIE